jgi:hypothetical protein
MYWSEREEEEGTEFCVLIFVVGFDLIDGLNWRSAHIVKINIGRR